MKNDFDPVTKPIHYNSHPSGLECIQVTEHMNFNLGNAVKYLWRNDLKNGIQDLKKALWYIQREIARLEKGPDKVSLEDSRSNEEKYFAAVEQAVKLMEEDNKK